MKLEHQIETNAEGLKPQHFKNLAAFVKYALQANGRDYRTILQRMTTVAKFATITKQDSIKKDLSKIKEIYQDFFVGDRVIDKTPSLSDKHQHVATYEKFKKGGVVKCSVSMRKSVGEFGSVICFHEVGREQELLTTMHFADDNLFFQTELNSNDKNFAPAYEECRLDFGFDKTNHLTKVEYLRKYGINERIYTDSKVIDLSQKRAQVESGMTK